MFLALTFAQPPDGSGVGGGQASRGPLGQVQVP